MFNFLKVAQYFQNVPSFAHLPQNITSQPHLTNQLPNPELPPIYSTNSQSDSHKPSNQKQGAHRRGNSNKKGGDDRSTKQRKNNKKDDDDSNNNRGGGLLEPIIEDITGFMKGRKRPASPKPVTH